MSDAKSTASGIAVIGMAGRFPGADDIAAFWANLSNGVESISFFSEAQLRKASIPDEVFRANGYVAAKGMLADADGFDAAFFGYSPAEAGMIDPQQRTFLECAWSALEDAGYGEIGDDQRVGVFGSIGFNTYLALQLMHDPSMLHSPDQFAMLVGNDKDFLCSRVAQKLRLRGPAVTIQSACSSSLLAVHTACQSLLTGEVDMALAGGVSISFPEVNGYRSQKGGIHSADGHCRAFDAAASGFVPGNGVGVVVLKLLDYAERDRDSIYAVILGSAANNDGGRSVGYTAPSVDGQAEAIEEAQSVAGVSPRDIGYVEAHGAATPLGDLIEVAALSRAFGGERYGTGYCAIGSVKTNVGHLDAAAGVTGLIKTVLALYHSIIPPSLNLRQPNPAIAFDRTPFYVATKPIEWTGDDRPRVAGVSSLGIGGTNVHVVLSQAAQAESREPSASYQLLPLSARSSGALEQVRSRLASFLRSNRDTDLADIPYTLAVGRRHFEYRDFVIAQDTVEAAGALADCRPAALRGRKTTAERDVVFLFPGGGAQHASMGRQLYAALPAFRETVDRCAALLEPEMKLDICSMLYASSDGSDPDLKNAAHGLSHIHI